MLAKTLHFLWFFWLVGRSIALAGLTFGEATRELPAPAKAGQVVVDFPFANESTAPVVIRNWVSSCHCLEAEIVDGKLRYAPGEKGILRARVKFENITRTLEERICLWFDGDPAASPSATLTARLVVPEWLRIEPRNLSWPIGQTATPKIIRIRADEQHPVHLTKLELSQEKFRVTQRTVTDGREYEIEVRPADTAGASFATLRIQTDSPLPRYQSLTAVLAVQPPAP